MITLAPGRASGQSSLASDGTLRRIRIPILMYHYISELPSNADDIRIGLTVSPSLFAAQLDAMLSEGYETTSFDQLENALMQGTPLPPHPIILTFDDGYDNHYATVFPLLRDRGMIGTFYVITGFLDEQREGYLTWQQAIEMSDAGMTIASHTKNHPNLADRDYDFLVYEMLGSFESIQQNLRKPSHTFAYPIGAYDALTLQVLAQTEVQRAVTTQNGIYVTSENRLEVPRLRISNDTSIAGLLRILQSP